MSFSSTLGSFGFGTRLLFDAAIVRVLHDITARRVVTALDGSWSGMIAEPRRRAAETHREAIFSPPDHSFPGADRFAPARANGRSGPSIRAPG